MKSRTLILWLIVLAPATTAIQDPESYGIALVSAVTQPMVAVYSCMLVVALILRRFWIAIPFSIGVLLTVTEIVSTQKARTLDASREHSETFRVIQYNAGELREPSKAVDWLVESSADLVILTQADASTLDNPRIRATFPYRRGHPSHEFLSRIPMTQIDPYETGLESFKSSISFVPSMIVSPASGRPFIVVSPDVPSPRSRDLWEQGVDRLKRAGVLVHAIRRATGLPVIAAGDFNNTPQGLGYAEFSKHSGLSDSSPHWVRKGTWPSPFFAWLGLSIDHVFVSAEIDVLRHTVGPNLSGDHRPVTVEIALAHFQRAPRRTNTKSATAASAHES